jgi:hypothetical protein
LPSICLISPGNEELISMFPSSTFLVKPVRTFAANPHHSRHASQKARAGQLKVSQFGQGTPISDC